MPKHVRVIKAGKIRLGWIDKDEPYVVPINYMDRFASLLKVFTQNG